MKLIYHSITNKNMWTIEERKGINAILVIRDIDTNKIISQQDILQLWDMLVDFLSSQDTTDQRGLGRRAYAAVKAKESYYEFLENLKKENENDSTENGKP